MNPYLNKLTISMPETERLIRNCFVDMNTHLEEVLHLWKQTQLIAFKGDDAVSNYEGDKSDVEWVRHVHGIYEKIYPGRRYIEKQYNVREPMETRIRNSLPEIFNGLNISFKAHKFTDGDYMIPHRDHHRTCGLYFIITSPEFETRWHNLVGDFEEKKLKYVPPEHLEMVHAEVIQRGKWYLFNNYTHHSVHKIVGIPRPTRKTFVIQLDGMKYDQAIEIFKDYETKMD